MEELTMESLEKTFKEAQERKAKYIAVRIEMEGFPEHEVIINLLDNLPKKLEYYRNAYRNDLRLKVNTGIRIVDFTYGNDFSTIESEFGLD